MEMSSIETGSGSTEISVGGTTTGGAGGIGGGATGGIGAGSHGESSSSKSIGCQGMVLGLHMLDVSRSSTGTSKALSVTSSPPRLYTRKKEKSEYDPREVSVYRRDGTTGVIL